MCPFFTHKMSTVCCILCCKYPLTLCVNQLFARQFLFCLHPRLVFTPMDWHCRVFPHLLDHLLNWHCSTTHCITTKYPVCHNFSVNEPRILKFKCCNPLPVNRRSAVRNNFYANFTQFIPPQLPRISFLVDSLAQLHVSLSYPAYRTPLLSGLQGISYQGFHPHQHIHRELFFPPTSSTVSECWGKGSHLLPSHIQ